MAKITIEPNVGKGATAVWETVPMVGDTVGWWYEGENNQTKGNEGVVEHRKFWPNGDITLMVKRVFRNGS
jgi:hypothetical protein